MLSLQSQEQEKALCQLKKKYRWMLFLGGRMLYSGPGGDSESEVLRAGPDCPLSPPPVSQHWPWGLVGSEPSVLLSHMAHYSGNCSCAGLSPCLGTREGPSQCHYCQGWHGPFFWRVLLLDQTFSFTVLILACPHSHHKLWSPLFYNLWGPVVEVFGLAELGMKGLVYVKGLDCARIWKVLLVTQRDESRVQKIRFPNQDA